MVAESESKVLGGVRVGFLTTRGVGGWLFCPTPEVQLDNFLHHKLGIPVEMVQFLLKRLLKQRILAVYHDFNWLLIATKLLKAKLHSLYVKQPESLSEILEGRSCGRSRTFYLRLRNPAGHPSVPMSGSYLVYGLNLYLKIRKLFMEKKHKTNGKLLWASLITRFSRKKLYAPDTWYIMLMCC